ncbi:MAG TPA: hypothetical protein VNN74_10735 [Candidatus Micrarchaeia archaeon]|nr:hypothetical protein [Candidatus Micrarchaeia archaeon]
MTTVPLSAWPGGGREAVELYTRTYRTVLRSSGELRLRVLESAHLGMRSSLHALADSPAIDSGALVYALRRLPPVTVELRRVVMGQSAEHFRAALGEAVEGWPVVAAPGRRRRWWWDAASGTLAVALASSSDVDDLVPTLVALQVEWNKSHRALVGLHPAGRLSEDPDLVAAAHAALAIADDDWGRLWDVFGDRFPAWLRTVAARPQDLRIRLLGGTQVGYARETRAWWAPIGAALTAEGLDGRPTFFVSSNAHALVNLLSGVAHDRAEAIEVWAERSEDAELHAIQAELRRPDAHGSRENFLYYAARRWFASDPVERAARDRIERERGILHLTPRSGINVAAQVIVLDRLDPSRLDPRLGLMAEQAARLRRCPAVVVNVQYPLGEAAYHILRQVLEVSERVEGIYILGKAATLNADVGDVMIADVVHDEHSGNTYWIDNCFSFAEVSPFMRMGSVLDRQRAVTVLSTFLQNRAYLEFYYRDAYTVVEMEAGPYLGALYEAGEAQRYPTGQQVDLTRPSIDLGVIHYASDTPYTQARTLGARGLSYRGMDATYAGSLAIARRILQRCGVLAEPSS